MVPTGSFLTTANNLPPRSSQLRKDIQRTKIHPEIRHKSGVLCSVKTLGLGSVRQTKRCKIVKFQMGISCSLQTGQEKLVK
jgi:hypothetical protein